MRRVSNVSKLREAKKKEEAEQGKRSDTRKSDKKRDDVVEVQKQEEISGEKDESETLAQERRRRLLDEAIRIDLESAVEQEGSEMRHCLEEMAKVKADAELSAIFGAESSQREKEREKRETERRKEDVKSKLRARIEARAMEKRKSLDVESPAPADTVVVASSSSRPEKLSSPSLIEEFQVYATTTSVKYLFVRV